VSDHLEGLVARAVEELRRPLDLGPALDTRIMAAVAAAPAPRARRPGPGAVWAWLARPRTLRLSPLAGLAAAAALVALLWWRPGAGGDVAREPGPAEVQFVFVDPAAASVSVVGDFNDWDPSADPLVRASAGGLWAVTLPLLPGRHRYAFVVDGRRWLPDPGAPRAAGDDFDTPSSVVTVGGDL
jgi:hypothetical protein